MEKREDPHHYYANCYFKHRYSRDDGSINWGFKESFCGLDK
jgi:hypothetical protein